MAEVFGELAALLAAAGTSPDHLLTAKQAATRLAVSTDWLYDHAEQLPFTVKLSEGTLRFSSRGLEAYIADHAGRRNGPLGRGEG